MFITMIFLGCIIHELGSGQQLLDMLQRACGLFLAFTGVVLTICSEISR